MAFEPEDFNLNPRLEFLQMGNLHRRAEGWIHVKKVPYLILARATHGSYELEFDGQNEVIPPDSYFIAPPNRILKITHQDGARGYMAARWLHLRLRINGLWDPVDFYQLPRHLSPQSSAVLDQLLDTTNQPSRDDKFLAALGRHELAIRALGLVCAESVPRQVRPQSTLEVSRLRPALESVESNPAGKHSVNSLAQAVGLSPAHFHERFLVATGTTPMKWVRTRRLELAAQMLTSSEATLAEIASRTGFLDAPHLSHTFSKHFGMAPRQYRIVTRGYGAVEL